MHDDSTDVSNETRPPWSHRRQEAGVIVWASFLTACLATMLFFAFFDPLAIVDALSNDQPPAWLTNRMAGYALGFFFFWMVTLVSALLTAYLIDTLPAEASNDKSAGTSRRSS